MRPRSTDPLCDHTHLPRTTPRARKLDRRWCSVATSPRRTAPRRPLRRRKCAIFASLSSSTAHRLCASHRSSRATTRRRSRTPALEYPCAPNSCANSSTCGPSGPTLHRCSAELQTNCSIIVFSFPGPLAIGEDTAIMPNAQAKRPSLTTRSSTGSP